MDKNYRLIAFDMDGTLLDSEKKIGQETVKAVSEAASAGKEVIFCTGRSPLELLEFRDLLPQVRFAVASNGAILWDMREWRKISESLLSEELLRKIFAAAAKTEHMVQFYSGEDIIYDGYSEERIIRSGMGEYLPMYRKLARCVTGYEAGTNEEKIPVNKLSVHLTGTNPRERLKKKIDRLGLPVEIRRSNRYTLEFTEKGVTKAYGLRQVAEYLGIPLSECIAVGDGGNDLDVLKAAGMGIAVGNACEEVKKIADAEVADNDHDGCAEAIRKYLL